jgi:ABC-type molybdate transport system substrate-binding protein
VEALLREYEQAYGVRTQVQYAGSGTLLANLEVARKGDLYIAADESFILRARSKGLVAETLPLASQHPVIAVPLGNPLGIRGVRDLLAADVRLGLAQPGAAAVGTATREALQKVGLWEDVRAAARVLKPTVMDLANDLALGSLDAAILWDSTVGQVPGLQAVEDDAFAGYRSAVLLGILTHSSNPTAALRLARYLSAPDRGGVIFRSHGFQPCEGDPWAEVPVLDLFCGAMLRGAIEGTLEAFAQREGVELRRTYNGCGILVAQMNAGARPDAYFACDQSFLDRVQTRFHPGRVVSSNPLVLITQPGNPLALRELEDLLRPDLRVGLADPDKSALGSLSRQVLQRAQLHQALEESGNVRVWTPTGDMLTNQLLTGSLDAALVYASNTPKAKVHVVTLGAAGARARQPWAAARLSPHRLLLERLYQALTADGQRAQFEGLGFGWEAGS